MRLMQKAHACNRLSGILLSSNLWITYSSKSPDLPWSTRNLFPNIPLIVPLWKQFLPLLPCLLSLLPVQWVPFFTWMRTTVFLQLFVLCGLYPWRSGSENLQACWKECCTQETHTRKPDVNPGGDLFQIGFLAAPDIHSRFRLLRSPGFILFLRRYPSRFPKDHETLP